MSSFRRIPDTTVRILTSFWSLDKPGEAQTIDCRALSSHMDMPVAGNDCQGKYLESRLPESDCRDC